ncbi:MAG TPA: hypothetical protein VN673_13560 [Clostridia bacterium]|nr:hypothetical protein [Clostridia bacterium]
MAQPAKSQPSGDPPEIKVVIRNAEGKYLAGSVSEWFFTDHRESALVFDFHHDRVQEQLEMLRHTHGVELVADPVPLEEIYETCDCCHELFIPYMVFFDGNRFFCPDCRKLISPRRRG